MTQELTLHVLGFISNIFNRNNFVEALILLYAPIYNYNTGT